MNVKTILASAAIACVTFTTSAFADIAVKDAYARSAGKMAKAGAAFMMIENHGDIADRLIDARSDVSVKVELHTHIDQGEGVVKMTHVPEGFPIPAHGSIHLKRGAEHVMFMGLKGPMNQGDMVDVTLVFEQAGEIQVSIPVDLERQDAMDHGMKHN